MRMTNKTCKDPGCRRDARWARSALCEAVLPEFLCSHHWELLRADFPLYAIEYNPVSLMPGEVLSDRAVVQTDSRVLAEDNL
jgi:hypothetical protein